MKLNEIKDDYFKNFCKSLFKTHLSSSLIDDIEQLKKDIPNEIRFSPYVAAEKYLDCDLEDLLIINKSNHPREHEKFQKFLSMMIDRDEIEFYDDESPWDTDLGLYVFNAHEFQGIKFAQAIFQNKMGLIAHDSFDGYIVCKNSL